METAITTPSRDALLFTPGKELLLKISLISTDFPPIIRTLKIHEYLASSTKFPI